MRYHPLALVTLLAGCAGAPPPLPPPPAPSAYLARPAELGEAQRLLPGQDIPAQWWTLFRSPALDALLRQALADSPSLARSSARLRQAEYEHAAQAGASRYPRVDARLSANRIDVEPQALGAPALPLQTPFNLFLASVGVSYQFDLFGANRQALAALQAGVDQQRYELEAARLMLAGNLVTAAIREAALREQIAGSEALLALRERQLAIVERLEQLGGAARDELARQRQELAQQRAQLPELRRQLEQLRHRLAVLSGQTPGEARLPEFRLADLQLPAELPLSLPSELARQRPDIRAAEALLQQAGARLGVATANLYPQITLSANLGSLSPHAGDLFGAGSAFYLLGASLTQPIFRGGELQARRSAAQAGWEQAGAAYREAVLQGLQNVADVLRALEADAQRLREREEAAAQARRHREILVARQRAGGVSQLALLDGEWRLQTALLERSQALADRHADSAALLQALGGGWWAAPAP
ncbi:efflux transporter outer membrane subunit [Roseateles violae]|uniref:Efflux transporter outer membrane subunit n=1 Tax=Roseateles violae TaxID=3058042 RepID=A0ABT8DNH5_9BURK|nr:efflux transporter outer membrane subunit [Pelomonas sp. PFR6]MDN3919538.1 efflux transporter outer membrane subunit [Pelomonas sp. PFR6]